MAMYRGNNFDGGRNLNMNIQNIVILLGNRGGRDNGGQNRRGGFGGGRGGGGFRGNDRNGGDRNGGGYNNAGGNRGGNNSSGGDPGSRIRPVDWSRVQLIPLTKNIYQESPLVKNRPQFEVDSWIANNQVTLSGHQIPRPIFEFNEGGYPEQIVSTLYKNYERPTTIQSISWPVALSGLDMVSIAKTGSGKTLGFLLPGLMHTMSLSRRRHGEGPSVLLQKNTPQLMGYAYTCLYGGEPKRNQANDLRRGIDICIATPGRLLDFLEAGVTTMSRCSYLVLDEADRMLDMGFEPQIRKIVSQIRPDRQTLMFSATWPKEVRTLAMDFQKDPVFLNVGSMEIAANHNIEQVVEVVDEYGKQKRLFEILEKSLNDKEAKIIIFVETKRKADDLTRNMRRDGWPALCIHGDKEQHERNWVLNEFKSGKVPILLATDVAARGLDVQGIKVVINFDYPNNSEDYVHRIGRTGRQDKKGVAYSFFTPQNGSKARDLIKVLEEANQRVPPELRPFANTSGGNGRNRGRSGGFGGGKRPAGGGFGGPAKRGRFEQNGYSNGYSNGNAAPRW
ncbi:hypothetical protein M3Y97_01073600 [Aphelenchoides bicaudatus]|nr:hypothetical protein M3Y97_01073600 [Aphelenchoides bicaudatus]